MTSILDSTNASALDEYLASAAAFRPIDLSRARNLALAAIRYYKGDVGARSELSVGQELERRWYDSLASGSPDYGVYDDDYFISDVWACWVVYSRNCVRSLRAPGRLRSGSSVVDLCRDVKSVADLGCGFGYTTAALKELFPQAETCGTQLEKTVQFHVASQVGKERGFAVSPAVTGRADLVFASEYFEHFERPVEHLSEVLGVTKPTRLVIANAFGARSIGHFNEYIVGTSRVSNKKVGRLFGDALRRRGYRRVETTFWNNRPQVWCLA